MTQEEHLLVILMEECNEVSHRVSKWLRFGIDDKDPKDGESALTHLLNELADLMAMLEMLSLKSAIPRSQIELKKIKVEKFLQYSKERGRLS